MSEGATTTTTTTTTTTPIDAYDDDVKMEGTGPMEVDELTPEQILLREAEEIAWEEEFQVALQEEEIRVLREERQRGIQERRQRRDVQRIYDQMMTEEEEEEEALEQEQNRMEEEEEEDRQRARARIRQEEAMEALFQREQVKWLGMFQTVQIYNYYLVEDHQGKRRGDMVLKGDIEANFIPPQKIVRRAVMLKQKSINNNNFQKTLKVGTIVYESMYRNPKTNDNKVTIYFSIQQDDMNVNILRGLPNAYSTMRVEYNAVSPMPESGVLDSVGLDKLLGCKNYSKTKDASGNNVVIGKIPAATWMVVAGIVIGIPVTGSIWNLYGTWANVKTKMNILYPTEIKSKTYLTEDGQLLYTKEYVESFNNVRDSVAPQCKKLDESWMSINGVIDSMVLGAVKVLSGMPVSQCDAVGNQSTYQLLQYIGKLTGIAQGSFHIATNLGFFGNLWNMFFSYKIGPLSGLYTVMEGAINIGYNVGLKIVNFFSEWIKTFVEQLDTRIKSIEMNRIGSIFKKFVKIGVVKLFGMLFNIYGSGTILDNLKRMIALSFTDINTTISLYISFLTYLIWFDFLLFVYENLCPMLLWSANQLQNCTYYQPKKKNELHREMLDALVKLKF